MTIVLMLLPYLAAALGLGGWAVPVVVAAVTGLHWPGWVKQIIMYAISVIAGGATYVVSNGWPTGKIDQAELGTLIVGIIAAAHLAYNYLWMNKVAPAIAAARSKLLGKDPAPTTDPDPDQADDYEEHPDSEDYDPDYVPGVGYNDPIPEGTVSGPAAASKESPKSV